MARRAAGAVPLQRSASGRLASRRSKTGDPACSQAMSDFVRGHRGGQGVSPEVHRILGRCRARARMLRAASAHEEQGRTLQAATLRHRADRGLGLGERRTEAQRLRSELDRRRAARAAALATSPPPSPSAAPPTPPVPTPATSAPRSGRPVARGRSDSPFSDHRFAESRARVIFAPGAQQAARRVLGRRVTPAQIASLAGAPHDATVRVSDTSYGGPAHLIAVAVEHPAFEAMSRTIRKAGSSFVIHNDLFKVREGHQGGTRLALQAFGRQVHHAHALGARTIETHAYRDRSSVVLDPQGRPAVDPRTGRPKERWAGYYVWPRFGYDAPIPHSVRNVLLRTPSLPRSLRHADRLRKLFATEAGRSFYQEHGESQHVVFHLRPRSYSMKTLDAYLRANLPPGEY